MLSLQVTELQDMIMKAEEIEHKYEHYFDLTIVNDDLQDAYDGLYTAVYISWQRNRNGFLLIG